MPLTGIANENEFYSAHYLDAILKEDLKGVAAQWKSLGDGEEQSPDRQLGRLRQDYFRLRGVQAGGRLRLQGDELLTQQRLFFRQVLECLGYEWLPQVKVLEDDSLLPVLVEVVRGNGAPLLWVVEGFNSSIEPMDVLSLAVPRMPSPSAPLPRGEVGWFHVSKRKTSWT
jgi:hypothetical protein